MRLGAGGVPREVEGLASTLAPGVDSTIRLDTAGLAAVGVPSAVVKRLPTLHVGASGAVDLLVRETLGTGGMGQVQLAKQVALDRDVALKTVLPAARDAVAGRLLLREAVITGRLEHPNIVPVHMLGVDEDGAPMLVMKRVEGVPWSKLDAAGPADDTRDATDREPLLRHLEVFIEVCRAVEFAHAQGFAHRDIKPSNVMIGSFGEVYLLDWGIATPIGTTAYGHAKGNEPALPLGTPTFMAPEMVQDGGAIDARTDVYLLGATLHRVLTGKPRHRGADVLEVLAAAIRSEPYPYGGEVPEELASICNRATAAAPGDRFQSAAALREEVVRYLRHRSSFELTSEGEALLAAIEELSRAEEPSRVEQNRLFTECRFAFLRALREWGENARARRGLGRCITAMVERDLKTGDVESAEALLAELPEPDEELAEAVRAARAAADREQERLASLRALAFQMDTRVGRFPRSVVMILVAALVAFTGLTVSTEGWVQETPSGALRIMLPFWLVLGVSLLVARRRLLENEANRKMMALIALAFAGLTLHRGLAVLTDAAFAPMVAVDSLIAALVAAAGAITMDRSLWGPAVVWVVGAAVLPWTGTYVIPVYSGFQLAGLAVMVLGWTRRDRKAG